MRIFVSLCLVAAAGLGCSQPNQPTVVGKPADSSPDAAHVAPDNSAVNQRDADGHPKTPIDQKENQNDLNMTAKIRQQVLDVKDLSINARNAKIITADGKVTLRGPVNSVQERDTLERIAREVAGDGNVDNQLEVAAANDTQR